MIFFLMLSTKGEFLKNVLATLFYTIKVNEDGWIKDHKCKIKVTHMALALYYLSSVTKPYDRLSFTFASNIVPLDALRRL